MDFTNYEENIYNEIQKDEMLRNFFADLSKRAQGIISFETERINKAYNVIKPSFDELLNDVLQLEKEGIVTPKEGFDIEACGTDILYEKDTPYFKIFYTLKFYGISFNTNDIEHMKHYDDVENFVKEMELNYKEWLSANKNIYKKLEQYEKKLNKLKNKGKTEEQEIQDLESEISEVKEIIKNDQELKLKIEFFKERSIEKATYILSIHNKIKELAEEYKKYLSNKKKADAEIKQVSKNIYDRVFEEINTNSMVEFDTAEIERKLFKLLIFDKLQKSPFVFQYADFDLNVAKNQEPKYDFDTTAVNWFIRTKKQSFNELFNYVFDNFETSMEEIAQKVLKK